MEPNINTSLTSSAPAEHDLPTIGTVPVSKQVGTAVGNAPLQTQPVTPRQARDSDVIEDTWIDAIRQVFSSNIADPYVLSNTVAALRKEYLERRYGKTVEVEKQP